MTLYPYMVAREQLAGLAEIAELFGVSKVTALKYARREDFPAPLDRLASGPVWRRADVEGWGKTHLPLQGGRPPRSR
jgi:predicted DNA-binding transcriptional regulator AlpA